MFGMCEASSFKFGKQIDYNEFDLMNDTRAVGVF